MNISRILDNTRDSFPRVLTMQSSSSSFLACTTNSAQRHSQPTATRAVGSEPRSECMVGLNYHRCHLQRLEAVTHSSRYLFRFLLSGSVSFVS